MVQLVKGFEERIPTNLSFPQWLQWLLQFSERWDFRRLQREAKARDINEGARWLLTDDGMSDEQKNLVMKSAHLLGLIGVDQPSLNFYDYVLVLGGARLSCLLRPRFAKYLLEKKIINTKIVALLGAMRPVAESEREATDTYAPGAYSEYDLLNAGGEKSFSIREAFFEKRYINMDMENKNWAIREYEDLFNYVKIISIAAPSSEPEKRRANSADTFSFFISKYNIPEGSSFLLVTSQIYVPYQQLEAVRKIAIPHKMIVETVGYPSDWNSNLAGMGQPSNYLQEIRSAIQSAQRFLDVYPI